LGLFSFTGLINNIVAITALLTFIIPPQFKPNSRNLLFYFFYGSARKLRFPSALAAAEKQNGALILS
jgi:hypothetical protein